ncbi:glycosyltransferase family 8 protein [Paenibacillus sp. P96]|uniref:Glycosyltransferase family 8 protein n=1 Tax=Paenibacillus zeirhizosphaerae TaxID=2987519 RepID=A0ABT9FQT7_9BACL|nr:glycosyltransferase family 8 protein [Paenibacillus sp. P96]MDP4097102.1 glycosyltransferase family 8 protein [Paenibacillus sp. P96]
MIELALTINDRDGKYPAHAGVVLSSIFSNTQQPINVHIVHDETLTEENKLKLTQLTESFHQNINFYHVSLPEDLLEISTQVHRIDHWTIASMYRLLLPQIVPVDRIIYLDCDIWVNMDINELWSVDLGENYLGAVLDQGLNLDEYFTSMGLNGATYFNSGVILFHLENIRNKKTWYEELLHFLRNYSTTTMPDQDALNALYCSKYIQLDQRFNTFAHAELDPENKIIHFAGEENKWWGANSPAAPLYSSFLAMTPWAGEFTLEPVSKPSHESSVAPPAQVIQVPEPAGETAAPVLVNTPVPSAAPATPSKRKRRRSLRLRLISRLRRKRITRGKYRSIRRINRIRRRRLLKRKTSARKLAIFSRKSVHAMRKAPAKKSSHRIQRL